MIDSDYRDRFLLTLDFSDPVKSLQWVCLFISSSTTFNIDYFKVCIKIYMFSELHVCLVSWDDHLLVISIQISIKTFHN